MIPGFGAGRPGNASRQVSRRSVSCSGVAAERRPEGHRRGEAPKRFALNQRSGQTFNFGPLAINQALEPRLEVAPLGVHDLLLALVEPSNQVDSVMIIGPVEEAASLDT